MRYPTRVLVRVSAGKVAGNRISGAGRAGTALRGKAGAWLWGRGEAASLIARTRFAR